MIFNRFIKFFADGCFDDLLLYWYSLMQEHGYAFDFSSVPNPYKSYLPKKNLTSIFPPAFSW